jgi:hypothetical protein
MCGNVTNTPRIKLPFHFDVSQANPVECTNGANMQQRDIPTARTNGDSLVRLSVGASLHWSSNSAQ